MASRLAPNFFALGLVVRATMVAGLLCLAAYLIALTHLYATALLVSGLAALVAFDLARATTRADQQLERFLDGLAVGSIEAPYGTPSGFVRLSSSFAKATAALSNARRERQQQFDYLQTLLDTVSASLIILEADGRVLLANNAARKLAGGPVHALENIAALGNEAAQRLATLAPGARQILRLADGRQTLASVAQFSVPGKPPSRLISLQRIAGELDAVELKAWQDMVRVLAHEMMNSLTPIASLSESIEGLLRNSPQSGGSSADLADALEAIKRRSAGLVDFIERYRKVAELPQPVMREVRLEQLVLGIDRLMRATLREDGIAFRYRVSPEDLTVSADPGLLEQAAINLLRNASNAVNGIGSPEVELACYVEAERVVIAVSDNGAGLATENAEQIFVPFFTTKPDGSGIGLSLVRQIALAHGGGVDVTPNRPHGTLFRMTFPAGRSQGR